MSSSLNIQLTDELRRYVDQRASDNDVYSTPSEYIRDLIRRDMEIQNKAREMKIASMLMEARNTPVTPLDSDFISTEIRRLKEQSAPRRKKA
jgi:Arc/MetJ-type ribon-helix-helix transcriptional regulator